MTEEQTLPDRTPKKQSKQRQRKNYKAEVDERDHRIETAVRILRRIVVPEVHTADSIIILLALETLTGDEP